MITWTLLAGLTMKSTLVLALAWLAAFALRRASAATRHLVWTAAGAALLALPPMALLLPGWNHPLANALLPAGGVTFHANATAAGGAVGMAPKASPRASGSVPADAAPFKHFDARAAAAAIWALGAACALLQMLFAYAAVWRLRRKARRSAIDAAAFGVDANVAVLETGHGMPMTAGILRPAIFLPEEANRWTPERLRMVLLHESAHILRGDAATQLMARAALCLQWFNPLAWMAWREFLKERERAADDLVLSTGARASDYAGHLLEVARTLQAPSMSAAAGVAMARRAQLEGRLLAILDSGVRRTHPGRAALALAVLAAIGAAVPLATLRAQTQAEQQMLPDVDATIRSAMARKNYGVLEQTAVRYEKLARFEEAQKLREAALAIRRESGETSPAYAEGLVKLGDLARKRNARPMAILFYKGAVAVGDMPETVPALIELGLDAMGQHDPVAAKDYLQRARNAAKAGNQMGIAMTWLAFAEKDEADRAAEVESLYRTAITVEDIDSPAQAMTQEMLARFLRAHDRPGEAEPLEDRARTIRKSAARALSTAVSPAGSINGAMRVGGGVTAPALLRKIEPEYSEAARAVKLAGTVLLKVTIDVDGKAKDIQVVHGLGMGLDEKAVEAVLLWTFRPGTKDGIAVPVQAQIEINFRLM